MNRKLQVIMAALLLCSGCQSTGSQFTSAPGVHNDVTSTVAKETKPESAEILAVATQEPKTNKVQTAAFQDQTPEKNAVVEELTAVPTQTEWTLADLEGMATANNPVLAEACARVEAARGNWVQVGLPPNPVLGYSGQQLGSHGQAEQQGVYIAQEFITGKKLQLNREVAAWEIQKAERECKAARVRVLTDVRISFYNVLITHRRRELATELVAISKKGVQAAEALFKGKEVSEADPLRARVAADSAAILLQNATNGHTEAWRQLAAVMGMPDMQTQQLQGELQPQSLCISWDEELQRLLSDSPEIAAAKAEYEAAQWSVERAYAEVIPNIDVQAVLQDDRGTGGDNGNLQVSIPLPLWDRNQGGIRKAEAEAVAAEKAVDRVALGLQSRLAVAYQKYESAQNQAKQYSKDKGILANSRRTLELIRTGYQAEEYGVLELLSAQRTFFEANLAYLDSLSELSSSVMEIRGMLLTGSLAGM